MTIADKKKLERRNRFKQAVWVAYIAMFFNPKFSPKKHKILGLRKAISFVKAALKKGGTP